MPNVDHLFIVGAGFSSNAGLPLTTRFTTELLNLKGIRMDGPSAHIVALLQAFVSDAFDTQDRRGRLWPDLEDIFTSVDLSANTGHHLGPSYSPSDLRTIRRALIVRTIRMLEYSADDGEKAAETSWQRLQKFFKRINIENCAFLSMNWDTVIEAGVQRQQQVSHFDYMCEAQAAKFEGFKIRRVLKGTNTKVLAVLKPHGSANWLYCDSCRQLFWFPPNQTQRIASLLFKRRDWEACSRLTGRLYEKGARQRQFACRSCGAEALGTRFATFSYRKALDFPMHERSWLSAERLLRTAKSWIFVGYSLPAADYEFKHLLKRVQLSRTSAPDLLLITGGKFAARTIETYSRFFGSQFAAGNRNIFDDSFNNSAISRLVALGALE
jgi:hypothetical protein